ncbi:MAG: hypothetical protein AB1670_15280, partial [Pseudomonadota bacterium]
PRRRCPIATSTDFSSVRFEPRFNHCHARRRRKIKALFESRFRCECARNGVLCAANIAKFRQFLSYKGFGEPRTV